MMALTLGPFSEIVGSSIGVCFMFHVRFSFGYSFKLCPHLSCDFPFPLTCVVSIRACVCECVCVFSFFKIYLNGLCWRRAGGLPGGRQGALPV